MTTIAWRGEQLAADSQITEDDTRYLSDPKIRVLNKFTIVGCAGFVNDCEKMFEFFSNEGWPLTKIDERAKLKKSSEAIVIYKGRVFKLNGALILNPVYHPYMAIGSGWKFAMAAMDLGMSAEEAVKFAGKHDVFTNDKVQVVNVKILTK